MTDIISEMLDGLFQKAVQAFYSPIVELFNVFLATPEVMAKFAFIDIIFGKLQVVGAALLVLIASWQSFKAAFAWVGFEREEPWRIAARALTFGFLIIFAKDIVNLGLILFERFVNFLWTAYGTVLPNPEQLKNLIVMLLIPGLNVTLFSFRAVMFIYLMFKFVKLAFRFAERLMLTALLVMCSPMAFAAGASQVTKGFLTGWVRLFAGNLLVQLMQLAIFISMVIYRMTDKELVSLFSFVIVVALIKVLEKLEDIFRDASMTVGIGRDFASAFHKIQSAASTGVNVQRILLRR